MLLSTLFYQCLHAPYQQTGAGADYAAVRRGDTLYLYLQHSRGAEDWWNNLDFPRRPYCRDRAFAWYAHRGFLRVFESMQDILAPRFQDPRLQNVVIVGYSHGAALAVLWQEYLWYTRPDLRARTTGYGFGCPRVLWGILSAEVRARWDRFLVIRNRDDIVTHLPPALLGYTHVGKMLVIGTPGRYSRIDAHRPENIMRELRAYETTHQTSKM